jgi:tagatose 1,6-diphosphate aldolase GatY/KbaY
MLDLKRLDEIRVAVARESGAQVVPLVLHGASGLDEAWILAAIERGVCKFNVNTDLRSAAIEYYREEFARESPKQVI